MSPNNAAFYSLGVITYLNYTSRNLKHLHGDDMHQDLPVRGGNAKSGVGAFTWVLGGNVVQA